MPASANHAQEQLEFQQLNIIRDSLVLKALSNPNWDFRTVSGIAKETGLSEDDVGKILASDPLLFRQSAVPDRLGRPMYALGSKSIDIRETAATVRMFLTKSIR